MKNTLILLGMAAAFGACTTPPASAPLNLGTAPAPIGFDGHVAGQATDMVFVLVADANPAVPGLSLLRGERLRLQLPAAFQRNPGVAIQADADTNLVLTKGWPQGAVRLADQYRVSYDEKSNSMVVTATEDLTATGANAPGIKVLHLRGRSFVNPGPGRYPVTLTRESSNHVALARWQGSLQVIDAAPAARLAPTNFHLPPGVNSDFQKVAPGESAPYALGLLLWGANGTPMNGVGVTPPDLTRFPRYTGGLLVQDTNQDRRLDPATDKVVGGIIGAAPQGAKGQLASSATRADGSPLMSGEVLRDAAYPTAAGGGKANPGLLTVRFKAGSLPGLYTPTFELIDGNSYRYTVQATPR